jgi:PPM family protein phosphatase
MSSAQRDSGEFSALADGERPIASEPLADDAALRIEVTCAGRTAVGQVRDHNEDNFVVANLETGQVRPRDEVVHDDVGERGVMFAVCDGMGGAAAGEVASQMAVDILVEALRRGGAPKHRDALARRLVSAVEEAGKRIYESAQRERSRRGMGTTATVAVLVDKVLFLAEVGDSRAYLLRGGQLKQLTKDQSLVNQLIEAGHLTEAEAEAFEHSNIILQALGTSESVQVDLTFVELRRGDRLLMCSDGLSGLVHADLLRSTLGGVKDPAECSSKLIEYAEAAGGHDNITVVVADFDGEGLTAPTDSDSFGYMQYPLPPSDDQASAFIDEDTESTFRAPVRDPGEAPTAPPPAAHNRRDRDQGESLLPLVGDTGDSQGNVLWFVGGALALAAGVAIWLALEPAARNPEDDEAQKQAATTAPAPQPPAEPEIEVKVYTDVAGAKLLVNGEDHGELTAEQSKSLRLKPGAYRFEAQSAGSPAAVSVVTVRGDMPMDVFLQAPKAAPEGEQPPGKPADGKPAEAPREAQPSETAPQAAQQPSGEAGPTTPPSDEAARARRAERAARRAERAAAAEAAAAESPAATPGATPAPAGRKPEPAAPAAPAPPVEIPDNPF